TRPLVSAFHAVLDAANSERLLRRAHIAFAAPFAAAVVVDGVDIYVTTGKHTLQQCFAGLRRDVPPPLGRPPRTVLIADGHADATRSGIAELEVGARTGREQ